MIILNSTGEELEGLHDNSFPFPDLSNPLYVSKKIAMSDGKIIGGGIVRITTEGILILNQDASLQQRSIASKAIINSLKEDIKSRGLDECHVFVQQANVRLFLKSLGFINCKGGDAMVIHF